MTERTEKEKMIAGELYFSPDPELVADRKFAREQMHLINRESEPMIKEQLLKRHLVKWLAVSISNRMSALITAIIFQLEKISMPIMIVSF